MGFFSDLRTLYHVTMKPVRGHTHAARIEAFYAGQSQDYDRFRARLLPGRTALWSHITIPDGAVWVDMGGGTAANVEQLGARVTRLKRLYVVDLSPSLIEMAWRRVRRMGWRNVEPVVADATTFVPDAGPADIVTFSYSLTMMPDWLAAIDQAGAILRPGGQLGVVDFYVARKHPPADRARHGWMTRTGWPIWFAADNVFLSADHLPHVARRFQPIWVTEARTRVPYLPFRVPYYAFLGAAPAAPATSGPPAAPPRGGSAAPGRTDRPARARGTQTP